MTYEIKPLPGGLGVEVIGLDLAVSIDTETADEINRAFVENVVLVFRGQDITVHQFLEAAKILGDPMEQYLSQYKVPECPIVSYVSNQVKTDTGKPKLLGQAWHTDQSFNPTPPKATMLQGVVLPKQGGNTCFANMRRAYEGLSDTLKERIDTLQAIHAYRESREGLSAADRRVEENLDDGVTHPVVRTLDEIGAKSIYINPLRIKRFVGLSADESTSLLDELTEHATSDRYVYCHPWQKGDIVIWDNRQSMHRVAHDYDLSEKRLMHRIVLEGSVPH
ncbi:MAG: TauD/TfdA family dioxygenase [Rhodospirillales bacterium]|jgi:taurine dioxygenase|nr:TauD/TfdA family dioxygenase [Rhodospirillales bacterium]